MPESKLWLDWIDYQNSEQVRWAIRYLISHGFALPSSTDEAAQLRQQERAWSRLSSPDEIDAQKLKIGIMQRSWARYADRKGKPETKSFSYEMQTTTHKKLQSLAKESGLTVKATLEALILNADAFKKGLNEKKKMEIAKIRPRPKSLELEDMRRRRQRLQALKETNKEWQNKVEDLLTTGARHWIALKATGLVGKNSQVRLEPDQEIAAQKLFQRWKKAVERDVETRTRLLQLAAGNSDRPQR